MKTIILIVAVVELCRGFPAKDTIVDLKPPQFESTYDSYLNSPIFTLQLPGLAPAKNFNSGQDEDGLSQDLQLPSLEPYNPNNEPHLFFNQGETYNVVRKAGKKSAPGKKYERGSEKKPVSPKAIKYQNHKYYDDETSATSYRVEKAPAQSPYVPSAEMSEILPIISAILKNRSGDFNERSFNQETSESLNLEHRLHPEGADDRLQFEMHGHNGPHSYKFGFDTGKGHDRQFRYEERDNEGIVHGHYGYYEKDGKLRVVNYKAHPKDGYSTGDEQEE